MSYIKKIRIKNFKSLEKVELDISSLNFLFGPNSSGKSSFIKALLFLNKNLFPFNSENANYKINKFTDLISYHDIVTKNDTLKNICYEFDLAGSYFMKKCKTNSYNLNNASDNILYDDDKYVCELDTTVKFEFSYLNDRCVLQFISYYDKKDNIEIEFTNPGSNSMGHWFVQENISKSQKFSLLRKLMLFGKYIVLDGETRNICKVPFDKIDFDIFDNNFNRIKNIKQKVYNTESVSLQKFYEYYFLIPNILKFSLQGLHFPTTREIPKTGYYLDNKKFQESEYFGFLNFIYDDQRSLCSYFHKANGLGDKNDKKIFRYYKNLFGILRKIKIYLSEKELNALYHISDTPYTFENKNFTINKLEDFFELNRLKIKYHGKYYPEIEKLRSIPKNISKYLLKLIKYDYNIESFRTKRKGYSDYYFLNIFSNSSILLNELLEKLDFDSLIYISKTDQLFGEILSYKGSDTCINIVNESSGLLQLLPILLGIAKLESDIKDSVYCSSNILYYYFSHFYPEDNSITFFSDHCFSLFIEQPELHIHPKLQCIFAEYLVSLVQKYEPFNHLFIETHSEHIIRKIQVLIAKGELDKNRVCVNYLYMKNGETKVKKMGIDDNGLFKEDWPKGFFDDSIDLTMDLYEAIRGRKN